MGRRAADATTGQSLTQWLLGISLEDSPPSEKTGITNTGMRYGSAFVIVASIHPLGQRTFFGGKTTSCGCYARDVCIRRSTKHNGSHRGNQEKLYRIWNDMKRRCSKKNRADYERYGGRGISVCDDWESSYEAFRDWALLNGYSMELTIDRIDVNGDYCPENCRWATQIEQQNNKRSNRIIEVDGNKMTIAEASRKYGIKYGTLASRIRRGASVEEAVFGKRR